MLKNNLCYALLNNGQLKEGQKIFDSISPNKLNEEMLYYTATKGLLEFKKNNVAKGRELYLKTINKCEEIKEQRLKIQAVLNLAIAEVQAKTETSMKLSEEILAKSEDEKHPTTILLRERLLGLSNKKGVLKYFLNRKK